MKKVLILLFATVVLAGCSTRYVITLNSRAQIVASTKPKFKDGAYVFKDTQGKEASVPAGRVSEIAPMSMATKNNFTPATKR